MANGNPINLKLSLEKNFLTHFRPSLEIFTNLSFRREILKFFFTSHFHLIFPNNSARFFTFDQTDLRWLQPREQQIRIPSRTILPSSPDKSRDRPSDLGRKTRARCRDDKHYSRKEDIYPSVQRKRGVTIKMVESDQADILEW